MFSHPLYGSKCILESEFENYVRNPVFLFDENDCSNRPDYNFQRKTIELWEILPSYVQQMFCRSFSKNAIINSNDRPTELEWIRTLVRFYSEIIICNCGNEVFTQGGIPCVCEKCRKKIFIPFRLEFSDYSIPGISDSRIYRCQLGICRADEALKPMGRVVSKKDNPGMLGIRNLSDKSWNAITPSGKKKHVMPDEIIPLKDGISFEINNQTINIKSN